MVLKNVEALFGLNTFNAHPGADHFAQPVDVDRLDVEFSLISSRILSDHGSAPKIPTRNFSFLMSTPISSAVSARKSAYDGVQVNTVEPKSCMIMIWRLLLPPDMGITEAPTSPHHSGPPALR